VINSYSGQELDDVKGASCHLYDAGSCRDLAKFEIYNCSFLDKHTALVVGMLYRDAGTDRASRAVPLMASDCPLIAL
jgi:stress response protein SCP2